MAPDHWLYDSLREHSDVTEVDPRSLKVGDRLIGSRETVNELTAHPAPMQPGLIEFFVKMLTDKGDLVFDPFGGSNTTGAVAERLGRRWEATEPTKDYVTSSRGWFTDLK